MSTHSPIAQEILRHFALRQARPGDAFDAAGFVPLAEARAPLMTDELASGLRELARDGCLDADHRLTRKGFEHINGVPETLAQRCDEIRRRAFSGRAPSASGSSKE